MLQEVMTKPGEIIFREIPVPEITEDQVLVKIMRIGICGSDIHVYHGAMKRTRYIRVLRRNRNSRQTNSSNYERRNRNKPNWFIKQ